MARYVWNWRLRQEHAAKLQSAYTCKLWDQVRLTLGVMWPGTSDPRLPFEHFDSACTMDPGQLRNGCAPEVHRPRLRGHVAVSTNAQANIQHLESAACNPDAQ